jgi:hypothetical protein
MSEDLLVLREILQRELETINAYERMLARVSDPLLRQIIEHVTDEEREHVSEMYELIMERDPQQRVRSENGRQQIADMTSGKSADGAAHVAAGAAAAGITALDSSETIWPDGAWSVGSLRERSR